MEFFSKRDRLVGTWRSLKLFTSASGKRPKNLNPSSKTNSKWLGENSK